MSQRTIGARAHVRLYLQQLAAQKKANKPLIEWRRRTDARTHNRIVGTLCLSQREHCARRSPQLCSCKAIKMCSLGASETCAHFSLHLPR